MHNFKKTKDLISEGNSLIRLSCPCKYTNDFRSLDEFRKTGGEVVLDAPLIVMCPLCEREYVTEVSISNQAQRNLVKLDLKPGADSRSEAVFSVGNCHDCGAEMKNTDLREGPGAPHIGWTHYFCKECETSFRPETYNH